MKFIELIWLCKQKKKARSNQTFISIDSCTELSKTQLFPVIKVKENFFLFFILYFGIVVFRIGGKNCIVKNKKWMTFPESRYINSNPVTIVIEYA